jgi:hypothetical protein
MDDVVRLHLTRKSLSKVERLLAELDAKQKPLRRPGTNFYYPPATTYTPKGKRKRRNKKREAFFADTKAAVVRLCDAVTDEMNELAGLLKGTPCESLLPSFDSDLHVEDAMKLVKKVRRFGRFSQNPVLSPSSLRSLVGALLASPTLGPKAMLRDKCTFLDQCHVPTPSGSMWSHLTWVQASILHNGSVRNWLYEATKQEDDKN